MNIEDGRSFAHRLLDTSGWDRRPTLNEFKEFARLFLSIAEPTLPLAASAGFQCCGECYSLPGRICPACPDREKNDTVSSGLTDKR